jgi:Bacterial extracellular solute-binding protein, family 7
MPPSANGGLRLTDARLWHFRATWRNGCAAGTRLPCGEGGYPVIVNEKFRAELPADVRAALEDAMEKATAYANEIAKKDNDEALAAVNASGRSQFVTLSAQERLAGKTAMEKAGLLTMVPERDPCSRVRNGY